MGHEDVTSSGATTSTQSRWAVKPMNHEGWWDVRLPKDGVYPYLDHQHCDRMAV
jgi:hypothetical protein